MFAGQPQILSNGAPPPFSRLGGWYVPGLLKTNKYLSCFLEPNFVWFFGHFFVCVCSHCASRFDNPDINLENAAVTHTRSFWTALASFWPGFLDLAGSVSTDLGLKFNGWHSDSHSHSHSICVCWRFEFFMRHVNYGHYSIYLFIFLFIYLQYGGWTRFGHGSGPWRTRMRFVFHFFVVVWRVLMKIN